MRNILFLVLAGVVGMAWAFPKGRPNCPVVGNWTDPEGTKNMWLSHFTHEGGELVTEQMSLNTSRTLITHVLTRPANNTILGMPNSPMVYYPSNVTCPDGRVEQQSVVVQAKCINDLLWVKVIPVSEASIYSHITSFTLRRQNLPVFSEALPPPAPPSPTPQFILVNITLPRRQEDDQFHEDDVFNMEDNDFPPLNDAADSYDAVAPAEDYYIVADSYSGGAEPTVA